MTPASWIAGPFATDLSHYWTAANCSDFVINAQYSTWNGLDKSGLIPGTNTPYGNGLNHFDGAPQAADQSTNGSWVLKATLPSAHQLIVHMPPAAGMGTSGIAFHNMTAVDNFTPTSAGVPVLVPLWRQLFANAL
jgi:hypothetical protein